MRSNRGKRIGTIGVFGVVALLVLAACGSSDSGSKSDTTTTTKAKATSTTAAASGAAPTAAQLDGKAFTAASVTGYDLVNGSEVQLAFEDGRLSVNVGCNSMGSDYAVTDGVLTWTAQPMSTLIGCSDELQAQDQWITGLLTKGMDASLAGDTLTLTSGDVVIAASSSADGSAGITGTTWTLTGTIANDAISSLPANAKPPTLTIGEDGTAQVFTGCNTGSSTVTSTDTTLTFGPMAMTRMACEDSATFLEHQVTAVLDGETTYVDDGTTLTIMNGKTGLQYTSQG